MNLDDFIILKEAYEEGKYEDHLIEQYKVMVGSIEKVSDRRASYNSYLLSIQTFLMSISGYLLTVNKIINADIISIIICVFGLSLSIYWILVLSNYKNLNKAKFETLDVIEARLPIKLFALEWSFVKTKKGKERYFRNSNFEKMIPIFFILAHIVIATLQIIK